MAVGGRTAKRMVMVIACGVVIAGMVSCSPSSTRSPSSSQEESLSPPSVRGKVVTCAGCKLNKLPNTKKFIKGSSPSDVAEIKSYENLDVEYIQGHQPELHIFDGTDDSSPTQKISIGELGDDVDKLRNLLHEKGFRKRSEL
mmetsp:Transcript_33637/g.75570  ORF Transcript_33637/g.75570 Transcript_33637/m.75570 type:complete len:142 (+) Transcript_33637:1-426(+)|eukprot:751388-Hanusia_phi.AAC.2